MINYINFLLSKTGEKLFTKKKSSFDFECKDPNCPHCLEDIAQMQDDDTLKENHIVDTNEMVCYTKQDVIDAIIKIHEIYSLHGQYNDTLEAKKLRLKGVSWHIQNILESLKKKIPTSSQTEISDEEIERTAHKKYPYKDGYAKNGANIDCNYSNRESFIEGIKWYREQLKKK